MKTTRYFDQQVLRKRPYLTLDLCLAVLKSPLRTAVQPDGRVRHFGRVESPLDGESRILRVVTLDDGETIHNAFFDRGYKEQDL